MFLSHNTRIMVKLALIDFTNHIAIFEVKIKLKLITKFLEEISCNFTMEFCFSLKFQCYLLQPFVLLCIMKRNEQAGVEIILLHMCLYIDDGGFRVNSS